MTGSEVLVEIAGALLGRYFRIFEIILKRIAELFGMEVSVSFDPAARRPIDERIAKIDEARGNLQEALGALGELSAEAEKNKAELRNSLERLEAARLAHLSEAEQLAQIKNIAQSDIEAFRKMAGIAPMRERVIGFIAGIFASLVAAGLWQSGEYLLK